MPKVLITTSGIGSRLGEMTKYTNKSLIRIGTKSALSHIISYYPNDTEFVITLGHFGEHVKEYLEVAHPSIATTFVQVFPYKGDRASQLYSISSAREVLQCPFIYHAADTLFLDGNISTELSGNWIGACKGEDASVYRSILCNQSGVISMQDKGADSFSYLYPAVVGIKDYKAYWHAVDTCLQTSDGSDGAVIEELLKNGISFDVNVLDNWIDVGNVTAFKHAQKYFPGFDNLDKTDQAVYLFEDRVIKFFHDNESCHKRVDRAAILKGIVPEIIHSGEHFFSYKKFQGDTFSKSPSLPFFHSFLSFCVSSLWTPSQADIRLLCKQFYYDKTQDRMEQFFKKTDIIDHSDIINEEFCPSLKELLEKIDWEWLYQGKATIMWHGDLHSENILFNGEFKLIDWREDFGGSLTLGDVYWDLAKLLHGLIVCHPLIKQNYFDVSFDQHKVSFELFRKHTLTQCEEAFYKFLENENYDIKKVKTLTALSFIHSAPLHHYPFDLLLFYLGKSFLNTLL